MKRIAVLVSGGGTNLQALIDAEGRGEIVGGKIAAVISTKEGAFALERAAKAGIPGYVLPRKAYPSNQAITVALVEKLKELQIDLVVLAGCMVIFTEELVKTYTNYALNALEVFPDSCTVEEFAQNVSSQHVIVTYGNHVEAIRDFCKMMDIELVM